MDFTSFIGPLISGASSLLGGIFGQSSASKAQQAAIDQQNYLNQVNTAEQEKFAKNTIQWKVADAQAAGINPLAALGASTTSFSNLVGSPSLGPDNSMGNAISSAGQDIGRAIAASTAQPSREQQLNEKLLEAKIANVNADTVRMAATASAITTKLGQPGTANVPLPPGDPRGPVRNLVSRYRDSDGNIYELPSDAAASPLQTVAAWPVNAAMAARTVARAVTPEWSPEWLGAASRAALIAQYDAYTPF